MRISEAAHILSIPRHKINYWKKTGLLQGEGEALSFEDLKRLRMLEKWRSSGLPLQRIRKMMQALATQKDQSPGQVLLNLELIQGPLLAVREDTLLLDPLQGQGLLDFTPAVSGEVLAWPGSSSTRPNHERPEDWSAQDDEILRMLEERLAQEERAEDGIDLAPELGEGVDPEEGARLFEAIRQSDPEKAMTTLEAIIDDRPDYLPARIELGNLFFERGELDSSASAYEAALELDSDCVEALYNLANVYYRLEKFAASIRLYQRSIDLDPGFPESYYNLALVYFSLRYFSEAAEMFEAYLDMDSDSPFARNARNFLDEIGSEEEGPGLFDDH